MVLLNLFITWAQKKFHLHNINDEKSPLYQEREIWWCALGQNVGHEIYGKSEHFSRPVLVIKKFNAHLFFGVPLTSVVKENPYYVPYSHRGESRAAMVSQLRCLDSKRLYKRMGKIDDEDFRRIRQKIRTLFDY